MERYTETLAELERLYEAGALNTAADPDRSTMADDMEQFRRAAQAASDELMNAVDAGERVKEVVEETNGAAESMGLAFESAMGRLITEGGKARDVMRALLQDIAQILYRETAGKAISGFIGDVVDNLFPGKAAGGPVRGGTPYLVGEQGPEIFVPAASGTIVPNHKINGGAMAVTINNMASGVDVQPREEPGGGLTIDIVRAALADDASRGGVPWVRNMASAYGLGRGG